MSAALRAEWTKLRTQTLTAWLMLGAVAATVGIGAAAGAATHQSAFVQGGDATRLSLVGVYLGQVVIAAFAVTAIAEEYATGMIRVTFAAMPRRPAVLAAKAVNLGGLTMIVSLMAVTGCLLTGRLLLPADGLDPAHGYALIALDSGATWRAAGGTVIYLALIALLSLGIAALIRDTAVSIGVVVALLFVPPLLAQIVGGSAARTIKQLAPMNAGLAIQHTTRLRSLPIQPWPGLAVTAGWALAAILLAALAVRVRDA
jgi:ABC-2 type transport system permease protein